MSVKECTHHKDRKRKRVRRCCAGLLIFLFIILLTILLVWAILQPKKPRFILQDATIFNFNVSAPNILSTSIQITIFARNPNDKIGVYYDRMKTYANYHNQQITYYTQIPSVYQGHKDVNIWSPFVFSNNVPISPYNGQDLKDDQQGGGVWLDFKVDGRVKWRVGTITTGHYHLHVTCSAYVPFGNHPGDGGIIVGNNAVKYQIARSCDSKNTANQVSTVQEGQVANELSVWNTLKHYSLIQLLFLGLKFEEIELQNQKRFEMNQKDLTKTDNTLTVELES